MTTEYLDISWKGPFEWPKPRKRSPLDGMRGVYLWTLKSETGYVVIGVGLSSNIRNRFLTHRRDFLSGKLTVLDIKMARQGTRSEIWHGFWAPYNTQESREEFQVREAEIRAAAMRQIEATEIFVAEATDIRLQQRLEAGIQGARMAAQEPYCHLPAVGMALAPRRSNEPLIEVTNRSGHPFCNLPRSFLI